MRNFLLLTLLVIFVVACTPITQAPTATLILSPTPYPTETKTSTPIASIIPEISETPSSTPDPAAQIKISSNGEYVAKKYWQERHPSGIETIEILDKNGTLLWQIPYQGEKPTTDPYNHINIYMWSKDSTALYFYYSFAPDGGDRAFWWDGFDLQRFDIATGNIQRVLPGKGFMAFAVSPDKTQIAYVRSKDDPFIIYVRNLSTAEEKAAYVKPTADQYTRVGDIHWSPSGKELVFQTESKSYWVQTIYLDVSTMQKKIIKEYELFTLWFEGWTDDGRLRFMNLPMEVFVVDVNTDESTIIGTATPRP